MVHLAWQAGTPEVAPLVATQPGGKPVVQLPDRYRLGSWAAVVGARPEDLADADGGQQISKDLRDGYVTLPWAGADPVGEHVRSTGRGTPAGRLIVVATSPDAPPLAELLRLALGLELALVVAVCDLRHNAADPLLADGLRWSVDVKPLDAPVRPDDFPYRPTLAAALSWCVECLTDAVAGAAPTDPTAPIPVPCRGRATSPIPNRNCFAWRPSTPGRWSPCASPAPAAQCTDTTTTAYASSPKPSTCATSADPESAVSRARRAGGHGTVRRGSLLRLQANRRVGVPCRQGCWFGAGQDAQAR